MVVTGVVAAAAVAATTTFYLRHSSTPPSLLVTAALCCLKPQKLPPTHFTFLSCFSSCNTMSDGGKLDNLRSNLDKLDTMTVKDLRQIMREVGIPTKGSKKELVSALSSFLRTEEDCENTASRALQPQQSNKMSLKRKVEGSLSEDVATISPKSTKVEEKKKSRGKIQAGVNGRVSEETSVVENETIDTKDCPTSKKTSKKISLTSGQASSVIVKTTATTSLGEPWTVLTHKKPKPGWLAYDPKTMRPPPLREDVKSVKLMSWNVNGLRALLKAEGLSVLQLAQRENFDILCLQETKIQEKDVEKIKDHLIEGYDNSFWTCSNTKLGYSGTAIISRIKPISVKYGLGIKDHDGEGRLVTLEFDEFYVLCGYVPNSGDGLRRLEYRIKEWKPSLSKYMKELEKSKPVILTGDLNCAHEEMDIYNPAGNRRSAGFTDEERESFKKNFLSNGFVDTFRKQHPSAVGYTYYGYRHGGRKTNRGWRLDYFLVSECITDQVHDSYVLPDIGGSDHCPIGLVLKVVIRGD